MLHRFIRASYDFTREKATRSAAWIVFVRNTASGFITTAHHTLMVLGILAIGALGAMFVKPDLADRMLALSPFVEANAEEMNQADIQTADQANLPDQAKAAKGANLKTADNERQQQWVTNWLAKRYRVATDATNTLVSAAYLTAKELKLDPLLILSVMAIESGFNPIAESPVGAQGLMQVMSKVHHDKFAELGGIKAALNPVANIRVGAKILKDYVTRGGSVEAGLKMYVGASAFESDSGYGAKVLAEYRRLKDVAMGKKVPIITTTVSNTTNTAPKTRPQENKTSTDTNTDTDTEHTREKSEQLAIL